MTPMSSRDCSPTDTLVEAVADELLRYLVNNPSAKDTREGIAKWWIARQRLEESVKVVDAALALLVKQSAISETTLVDGTKVYSPRKLPQ